MTTCIKAVLDQYYSTATQCTTHKLEQHLHLHKKEFYYATILQYKH